MTLAGVLVYIAVVNVMLLIKLAYDRYSKLVKKEIVNHDLSAGIDTFVYFIVVLLAGMPFAYILVALSYRWIMFDWLFDMIDKDSTSLYGSSSKIDIFMVKLGKWHIYVKAGVFAISLILALYEVF